MVGHATTGGWRVTPPTGGARGTIGRCVPNLPRFIASKKIEGGVVAPPRCLRATSARSLLPFAIALQDLVPDYLLNCGDCLGPQVVVLVVAQAVVCALACWMMLSYTILHCVAHCSTLSRNGNEIRHEIETGDFCLPCLSNAESIKLLCCQWLMRCRRQDANEADLQSPTPEIKISPIF